MPGDKKENDQFERVRRAIRAVLAESSSSYDSLRGQLLRLNDLVRSETGAALQPALNERMQRMPHATYEEKKELAKWINGELREFGLACRCPKTGHATSLQANPGHDERVGRFRFDRIDESDRRTSTFTTTELPTLELRPSRSHSAPGLSRGERSR
ncbi:MAG: hypothetical protein HUU22_02225 [Phycisphaerae bacterium]|nr:hypothetical protein [Phycisphaerae bacterium]NUQ44832.1 hypothetical protein [Phycisphaerae bacterium]